MIKKEAGRAARGLLPAARIGTAVYRLAAAFIRVTAAVFIIDRIRPACHNCVDNRRRLR